MLGGARPAAPLPLLALLLTLQLVQPQPHAPGDAFPGASSAEIVAAALGVPLQGNVVAGVNVWYSFAATADRAFPLRSHPPLSRTCMCGVRAWPFLMPTEVVAALVADAYVATTSLMGLRDTTLSLWQTPAITGQPMVMLASDDDSGIGLASMTMYVPPQDVTIYVRVRAYSRTQSGRFNVTMIDATAGAGLVGPAPCAAASGGGASCVLPLGCIESFNDNREGCPGEAAAPFTCDSSCAPMLVPWYNTVQNDCQQLLRLLPAWGSYTALGIDCDVSAYGGSHLAIIIRESETQRGRIGRDGYQEWFRFTARGGATYQITTTLGGGGGSRGDETLHDSVLSLYGGDGTTVLVTNDDFDGLASRILWTAPTSGAAFIMVRGYNPHDLGAFELTLSVAQPQGPSEADLCTQNGARVPWRAIHFRAGCEVWVNYEDSRGLTVAPSELLEVGGVGVAQLLRVTSDICGSVDLVRAFAEDFEGIAQLAGVATQGVGEAGQVQLTVRSSTGAVTHPTATFTQMNQRYTRAQWRENYDDGAFSGRTCPAWVDDDSTVISEVAVEGAMSAAEFRRAIAEIVTSTIDPSGIQHAANAGGANERLVTVTEFSQTLASGMLLPGVMSDFDVGTAGNQAEVDGATARQTIIRAGIAESINCCVANASIVGSDIVFTGIETGRRRLQSVTTRAICRCL